MKHLHLRQNRRSVIGNDRFSIRRRDHFVHSFWSKTRTYHIGYSFCRNDIGHTDILGLVFARKPRILHFRKLGTCISEVAFWGPDDCTDTVDGLAPGGAGAALADIVGRSAREETTFWEEKVCTV